MVVGSCLGKFISLSIEHFMRYLFVHVYYFFNNKENEYILCPSYTTTIIVLLSQINYYNIGHTIYINRSMFSIYRISDGLDEEVKNMGCGCNYGGSGVST